MGISKVEHRWIIYVTFVVVLAALYFYHVAPPEARSQWVKSHLAAYHASADVERHVGEKCQKILEKANLIADSKISYNPAYVSLKYPGGDVAPETGVCTDVVIRSLRVVGIDLQKEVHESMKKYKSNYPKIWGLKTTDTNIDHRRVPNLMVYFSKHAKPLPLSEKATDYQPCDIVTWDLGGGLTHIGVVSNSVNRDGRPLIIHHIGGYPQKNDMLFQFKVIGHYTLALDSNER